MPRARSRQRRASIGRRCENPVAREVSRSASVSLRIILTMLRTARLVALFSLATGAALAQPSPRGPVTITDRPTAGAEARRWPPAQRLQGRPECAPGTPFPPPGAPFPCRWPLPPGGPELSLSAGVGTGLVSSDSFTTGSVFQLEAQADLFVTRSFGFGARYRFLNAQTAGDRESLALHPVSAGLRLRLFDNESARQSWTFEPEGGYAFTTGGRAEGGPFVGLSIARSVGGFMSESTSANVAVVLSGMQGLGALSDVRVFSLGLRLSPSFNAFAPLDLATAPRPAAFHYTWGVKWFMLGGSFGARDAFTLSPGFALVVGLPVTRWFEPVAQVDMAYWLRTLSPDEPAPIIFSFLGGVRLRMNGLAPLYASVLGGWQISTSRAPQTVGDGAIVDVGFGLNLLPCGGALQIGVHYRRGISHDAEDFNALFLVLGGTFGSREGSVGEAPLGSGAPARCGSSPTTPSLETRRYGAGAQVVATPVEVSVVIGAALLGGLVQFHIDPSALPIERLVRAGYVTVRVEGPPEALSQASAELRAALDARGVTVQHSATLAISGASEVRAVFTVWPPGARPR